MVGKNPWAQRWRDMAALERGAERKAMLREAQVSENEPTFTCQYCGETVYHRPGVGGWWCGSCKEPHDL